MEFIQSSFTKIESKGPDWLTLSTNSAEDGLLLIEWFNLKLQGEVKTGAVPKKWRFQGYIGIQASGLKCGVRVGDETIVMLTGDAQKLWYSDLVLREIKATRMDLQVTVALDTPRPALAHMCYLKLREALAEGGKGRALKYISSPRGDTVYVGKRSSSVYLRLYDKSIDLGETKTGIYWRYEVEFKRSTADRIWKLFHVKQFDAEWVAAQVFEEFIKRGVIPVFDVEDRILAVETGARVSTVESQLSWLRRCVAPVIAQLFNLGYEEKVLKAIKLKHIVLDIGDHKDGLK